MAVVSKREVEEVEEAEEVKEKKGSETVEECKVMENGIRFAINQHICED
jgi:hypothetical protein